MYSLLPSLIDMSLLRAKSNAKGYGRQPPDTLQFRSLTMDGRPVMTIIMLSSDATADKIAH